MHIKRIRLIVIENIKVFFIIDRHEKRGIAYAMRVSK